MNPLSIQIHPELLEQKQFCPVCKMETNFFEWVLFVSDNLDPIHTKVKYCEICETEIKPEKK